MLSRSDLPCSSAGDGMKLTTFELCELKDRERNGVISGHLEFFKYFCHVCLCTYMCTCRKLKVLEMLNSISCPFTVGG